MQSFVIDYSEISPMALRDMVKRTEPNACCMWGRCSDDCFSFTVVPQDKNKAYNSETVRKIVEPYA